MKKQREDPATPNKPVMLIGEGKNRQNHELWFKQDDTFE